MNICIVAHNAYGALTGGQQGHIGGVERQTLIMSRWLVEHGHKVTVITWDEGGAKQEQINAVNIVKICKHNAGIPGLRFFTPRWRTLNSALSSVNAEIYYHNCFEQTTGQVSLWCQKHHKAFIYTVANDTDCRIDDVSKHTMRERYLFRYGLRHANLIITQTEKQSALLLDNFSLVSTVIPMPAIAPQDYSAQQAERETFTQTQIIWVGRICKVKRLQWLIDAAAQLTEFEFVVVGAARKHDKEANQLIAQMNSAHNIDYRGPLKRTEMGALYKNAAVLCCTSLVEGFPNTFLEAWSYQTPLITTFDPDNIVEKNQLGISATNLTSLVDALKKIMTQPALKEKCARNALAYFKQYHALDASMVKFENAFKRQMVNNRAIRYFDKNSNSWHLYYQQGEVSISHLELQARLAIAQQFITTRQLQGEDASLDLGCGTGDASGLFANNNLYAIDFSEKMIAKVRSKYPWVKAIVGEAKDLPFQAKKFRLVLALGVIEYISHHHKVLGEIDRVLTNNGYVVMSFPNKRSFFRKLKIVEDALLIPFRVLRRIVLGQKKVDHFYHQQWDEQHIRQFFVAHGFEIISIDYCSYGFLSPRLANSRRNITLSKWLERKCKGSAFFERALAHTAVVSVQKSVLSGGERDD